MDAPPSNDTLLLNGINPTAPIPIMPTLVLPFRLAARAAGLVKLDAASTIPSNAKYRLTYHPPRRLSPRLELSQIEFGAPLHRSLICIALKPAPTYHELLSAAS